MNRILLVLLCFSVFPISAEDYFYNRNQYTKPHKLLFNNASHNIYSQILDIKKTPSISEKNIPSNNEFKNLFIPPVELGFFCIFELKLEKKLKFPINFELK